MPLHRLVAGFADAAGVYERGRPGYPPSVVTALADALGLAPGASVVDLGAGTGKLARALLAGGYDVVAVEPLEGMRKSAAGSLGDERVLAGTAEAIPLASGSVDAVVSADAFHWFDGARAVPEIARVLRPGGGLAILFNVPQFPDPPPGWAAELGRLLDELRPEHPAFTGDRFAALEASELFGERSQRAVTHVHDTDREGIVANMASISFIGGLPDDERAAVLGRVDALLRDHGIDATDWPVRVEITTCFKRR